jgi:sulfur carrier protein ThiS
VASNHLNKLLGIQDCFIVLTRNGEIVHTWADLNVVDYDVAEVLQYPIQNDGCVNLYLLYSF